MLARDKVFFKEVLISYWFLVCFAVYFEFDIEGAYASHISLISAFLKDYMTNYLRFWVNGNWAFNRHEVSLSILYVAWMFIMGQRFVGSNFMIFCCFRRLETIIAPC